MSNFLLAARKSVPEALKGIVLMDSALLPTFVNALLEGHLQLLSPLKDIILSNVAVLLLSLISAVWNLGYSKSSKWPWARVGRYAIAAGIGSFVGIWFSKGIV